MLPCVQARLRWIMGHERSLPLRFLVPAVVSVADTPTAVNEAVLRALPGAAGDLGLALAVEASFATRSEHEVIRLYRVERPATDVNHTPPAGSPGTAPPP
jgi:hypothetical protein